MKKRVVPLFIALVMILSISANAAIEPRATIIQPVLSFSGTTANCSVLVTSPTKQINVTLSLWQGNILIDSWSGSGTTVVSVQGTASVVKGRTYTLQATGTVDGEPINAAPVTRTC